MRVGAIAFNQKAEVLQSPTRDHDAVREALGPSRPRAAPRPATPSRRRSEHRGHAPAAIVLLSDGKSVRGSDPLEAAQAAKERKIPIYTVALGTAQRHDQRRQARAARPRDAGAQIAKLTGGRSFTAGDLAALDQVYERLGSQVATEKQKLEVTNLFAGGALALMALSALSSIRMFGRLL